MFFIDRALISGTLAAAAVTAVASLAARRRGGSAASALNATSHFLWGERAGREDACSVKYTATGFVTDYGASDSVAPARYKRGWPRAKRASPA